jgi:hypothetical protein
MAGRETGSGRVVLLIIVAFLAIFVFVPRLVDPDFGTEEPPWGDRATVEVREPNSARSEFADIERTAEIDIDRTDPAEVLRDAIADSVPYVTYGLAGIEPTAAGCDEVELGVGEGTVTCYAEHQNARMHYDIAIEDLTLPPAGAGGLMTWHQNEVARDVIVTQEGLNAAFWRHLGETGRRDEDQEIRCDRVPEPVTVRTDQLHRFRCYRRPPQLGASRVYFLSLAGPLSFAPFSGVRAGEAEGWQPSEQ